MNGQGKRFTNSIMKLIIVLVCALSSFGQIVLAGAHNGELVEGNDESSKSVFSVSTEINESMTDVPLLRQIR
jgi:hypothetical protein